VSWFEAAEYCNRLSELEDRAPAYQIEGNEVAWDRSADGYRLATEAEWEYAARGGSEGAVYAGEWRIEGKNKASALDPIAWFGGNSGVDYGGGRKCGDWPERHYLSERCGTHPVATREANALGVFDMLGNVREWCWDWHGVYSKEHLTDPGGPGEGKERILRGGGWCSNARFCRGANRSRFSPNFKTLNLGFRPVASL